MIKKILKVVGLFLLLLIGFAFAAPFLFKSKITNLVKTQINKNIAAKVDFGDVDISLFRHFPRLAVGLDSLRITGIGEFSEDTLISARQIDIALNLMSVISGDVMKIHSIHIDQPRIHAIVHQNGHANYNITLPDTTQATAAAAPAKPFKMELQQYAITNGTIYYRDDTAHMSSEIAGLNHSGSGDFTSDLFTLKTETSTESLSFTYGGVPYLVRTQTKVVANFDVDNKSSKYTFKVDDLSVNDLKLHTEGSFQLVNDSTYDMDIKFNGPALDFKSILSLVPSIYKKDFASIKTSGQASLEGWVKGRMDARHIPAYHVALGVKNGSFQYPDLPRPVKNINVSLIADNPDGVTDHTVVNIPHAHLEMEDAPFDFRLLAKTPVSDPYIDAEAKGRLDLAKVAQFVKLESGTRLTGLLNADMNLKGNLSAIEKQQYEQFSAGGSIGLTNFSYASAAYPSPITLDNLLMSFNPKNVTLSELKGAYLKTHFNASGTINNLLSYALKNQALDGSFTVKADEVDLTALMGTMNTTKADPNTTVASAPFAVPAHVSIVLHAAIDKLHYENLDMNNLSGSLKIEDERVSMENIKADALDGTLLINGSYSTRESKKNPAIAFTYHVQHLDVQKTYIAFNTVQKLMPAGKFIAGKFSSTLTMNGKIGENMSPDLNSLNGEGSVLLTEGSLNKFEPLNKLAQTLNVDQLKEIPVKDIKTNFSFHNGRVIVDPFHVKLKDIDMEVGGSHGFDQSLDYALNLKLPRSLLGGQANSLVNDVVAKAGSKGVPVKLNDLINVGGKMGGTITNPVLKMDLAGALSNTAGDLKHQATDLVKAKVEDAKQQVKDTAKVIQQQLVKDAGDELKKQLLGKKDTGSAQPVGLESSKSKAAEAGKGLLNGLFKKKS